MATRTNCTSLIHRIASAVGEQRAELGVTQEQLACLADVSVTTIHRIEHGARHVRPAVILRVAGVLNTLELVAPPRGEEPGFDLERELASWTVDSAGVVRALGQRDAA